MMDQSKTHGRAQAWQLLTEWTASESLRKHALAVEACVVAMGEAEAGRMGLAGNEPASIDPLSMDRTIAAIRAAARLLKPTTLVTDETTARSLLAAEEKATAG